MSREGVPLLVIQRQLRHADLTITSVYLRGIDNTEIVHAVHERPAPMIPATHGLYTLRDPARWITPRTPHLAAQAQGLEIQLAESRRSASPPRPPSEDQSSRQRDWLSARALGLKQSCWCGLRSVRNGQPEARLSCG